jgi:hypothetical protein
MADEELRLRLAELIVEALEVGSGKHERDVTDEIFDSFGLEFHHISEQFPARLLRRADQLRQRAARDLAAAAPTADDLLNEVVRVGGRFIAMLDAVYARLTKHAATVGGGNAETFRFRRGGIDEDQLTISPEFIERVRQLERSVRRIETGWIDEEAILRFLSWDNGPFYGTWPLKQASRQRLAAWVIGMDHAGSVAGQRALGAEETAAARLVAAAERVVRARIARLETLSQTGVDPEPTAGRQADEESYYSGARTLADDLESFSETGLLGLTVIPDWVEGVNSPYSLIGLRADLTPVVMPVPDDRRRRLTPVGELAAFVAMWRLGLRPVRDPERGGFPPAEPTARQAWLDNYRTACEQATSWLENDAFQATGTVDVDELLEAVIEFLNLPLWRKRDLLYEIWVLCATLDACELADWTAELNGLTRQHGEWVLSVGRSRSPVATLRHTDDPSITLDVWREPARTIEDTEFTPDVTVSTPSPYAWDLLVVEAKDRVKMASGLGSHRDRTGARSALGVAERYAQGLRPRAVWVCNHCEFRQPASAEVNHGNVWTQVHVADKFRPGQVPGAFAESVRASLAPPPHLAPGALHNRGLVLVIDVTYSMRHHVRDALAFLAGSDSLLYDQFRAVLYCDHFQDEPFLVRKVGPFADLPSLLNGLVPLPVGSGGDIDEALEDAMARCRELVDDIGPQDLLVLTDAPPHPVASCPYGIDFEAEVRSVLDAGCTVRVASDWWGGANSWDVFNGVPGFEFAPLSTLLSAAIPHSR